jgi:transcriptional regulator with XRE-family HTH domain
MFARKLPIDEVERLLSEGKSQSEIARILNFSKQAVSQYVKRKNLPATTTPRHVSSFDGLRQLKRLMSPMFEELKALNDAAKKQEIDSTKRKDLNLQRLKFLAEGRKQLAFALLIDEKRFSFEQIAEFQNYVIEVIGELDAETRDKIISKLRAGRTLKRLTEPG